MSKSIGVGFSFVGREYSPWEMRFEAPKHRVPPVIVPTVFVGMQLSSLLYLRQLLLEKTLVPLEAVRQWRCGRKIAHEVEGGDLCVELTISPHEFSPAVFS